MNQTKGASWLVVLLVCLTVTAFLPSTLDYIAFGRPDENLIAGQGLSPERASQYQLLVRATTGLSVLGLVVMILNSTSRNLRELMLLLLPFVGTAVSSHFRDQSPALSGLAAPACAAGVFLASRPLRLDFVVRLVAGVLTALSTAGLLLAFIDPAAACFSDRRFSLAMGVLPGACGPERLAGLSNHPNALGAIVATALIFTALSTFSRATKAAIGALLCVILILTESRSTAAATVAAFFVVVAIGRPGSAPRIGRFVLAALALASSALAFFSGGDSDAGGYNGRQVVWDYVIAHWREQAFLGHGVRALSDLVAGDNSPLPAYAGQAHNQFFQSLYTTGLLGLGLLILFAATTVILLIRGRLESARLAGGLLTLLIVRGFFESPFDVSYLNINAYLLIVTLPIVCRLTAPRTNLADSDRSDVRLQPQRSNRSRPGLTSASTRGGGAPRPFASDRY